MMLGPDGKLYVGVGAFEPELAQDPTSLAGKLLRLNSDGSVPDDDPTPGSAIFLGGVRNTQAYDWYDSHHLLVMDHGPGGFELGMPDLRGHDEFNVARAGENLGWPTVWGCQEGEDLRSPVLVWESALPPGGGAIYTGDAIPGWHGSFVVASLGSDYSEPTHCRHLQGIELDRPRATSSFASLAVTSRRRLAPSRHLVGPHGVVAVGAHGGATLRGR